MEEAVGLVQKVFQGGEEDKDNGVLGQRLVLLNSLLREQIQSPGLKEVLKESNLPLAYFVAQEAGVPVRKRRKPRQQHQGPRAIQKSPVIQQLQVWASHQDSCWKLQISPHSWTGDDPVITHWLLCWSIRPLEAVFSLRPGSCEVVALSSSSISIPVHQPPVSYLRVIGWTGDDFPFWVDLNLGHVQMYGGQRVVFRQTFCLQRTTYQPDENPPALPTTVKPYRELLSPFGFLVKGSNYREKFNEWFSLAKERV